MSDFVSYRNYNHLILKLMGVTILDSDQVKKKVKRWAESEGSRAVVRALVSEGLSPSLASFLARGQYHSDLKIESIKMIEKALGCTS